MSLVRSSLELATDGITVQYFFFTCLLMNVSVDEQKALFGFPDAAHVHTRCHFTDGRHQPIGRSLTGENPSTTHVLLHNAASSIYSIGQSEFVSRSRS